MFSEQTVMRATRYISRARTFTPYTKEIERSQTIFVRNLHSRSSLKTKSLSEDLTQLPRTSRNTNEYYSYLLMAGAACTVLSTAIFSKKAFLEATQEPEKSKIEKDLENIKLAVREVEDRLEIQEITKAPTIIIGDTGSGKTVVYNYLIGVPLEVVKHNGSLVIDRKSHKEDKKGKISHGYSSETRYLNVNGDYCDSPGFQGTSFEKGTSAEVQDIVNAYSLYTLFKRVKKCKLVLVVPESHFDPQIKRGKAFVDLLKQLEDIFPDQASKIKKGLNLIVTFNTQKDEPERAIRSKISQILADREERGELSPFQKEILEFFSSSSSEEQPVLTDFSSPSPLLRAERRISFFDKPTKKGDIVRNKMLIESDSYAEELKPQIAVTAETKVYVHALTAALVDEMSSIFSSFLSRWEDTAKDFIRKYKGDASALRRQFEDAKDHLVQVKNTTEYFSEDIRTIGDALGKFVLPEQKRFAKLMERYQFLREIKSGIHLTRIDFKGAGLLPGIQQRFDFFSAPPTIDPDQDELKIRGCIVGTSDIKMALSSPTSVLFMGSKALLVDMDFSLEDSQAGGKGHACFASPLWVIQGERYISLKGKDGASLSSFKASRGHKAGEAGENGLPGNPGYNGGNFLGIVDDLENGNDLTIDLRGGNGGPGQQGGDGADGESGIEGSLDSVESRRAPITFSESLAGQVRTTYESGKKGTRGGNAGQGGIGGIPGKSGEFNLKNTRGDTQQSSIQIILDNGKEGLKGDHGKPGKGGSNGHVYKGTYEEKTGTRKNLSILGATMAGASSCAAAGAGIGLKIGGTVDIASAGASGGTITLTSTAVGGIVGGVGGGLVAFGGACYHYYWGNGDGWSQKPALVHPYIQFAPDGKTPEQFNLKGRLSSIPALPIDKHKIFSDFRARYTHN